MKLLHISTFLQGGAGKMIVNLAKDTKARGDSVWIACTKMPVNGYCNYEAHLNELKKLDIPVAFLRSTFDRSHENLSNSAEELLQIMKKFKIEIVHSHSANPSLIALIAKGRERSRIPILQTMHGWGIYKNKQQEQKDISTMELLDKVISISKSSECLLRSKGLENQNLRTIYNGLETLKHNSCNLNDHHMVAIRNLKQSGVWVSGVIGTVDERKNQRLLIEAAREIPSHLKVHFFIVGEGEETVMLKELCIKYELMDRFTFTGYKENGHELTHFFDLLISTSRSEGGPPLSVIEAFAEKTLVLASDVPEHREAINDGKSGFLFKNNDPKDLAEKIQMAVICPRKNEMRQEAFHFFSENFRLKRTCESYNQVYRNLLLDKK